MRDRPIQPRGRQPASFALCVCAYNEEAVIRHKAENLLALKRAVPNLEILVYVDAATDRTARILREYGMWMKIHNAHTRQGKTYGMNLLVEQTMAEVVIFSDANVMINEHALAALTQPFVDPEVGCVCGHLKYVNANASLTAGNGSLYWRLEEYIKRLESDTGSVMGADGSLFAIRRQLHHPPPEDMIDDMFVSFSILCDGYRIVRAPDAMAYEESVTAAHEEFRRKIRIACQAFNVHRVLWPRIRQLPALDVYKYVSHKFLRWLSIGWLALAVLFFEAGMMAAGLPMIGFALLLLSVIALMLGGVLKIRPVPQIADILMAFLGSGLGVCYALLGEKFQTWQPALSMRQTKEPSWPA